MGEDNFRVMYRILKALDAAMDCDDPTMEPISAEALGISENRRNRLLSMMQDEGYVSGVTRKHYYDGTEVVRADHLEITIKGLEYLAENSMMAKVANTAKGIIGVIS